LGEVRNVQGIFYVMPYMKRTFFITGMMLALLTACSRSNNSVPPGLIGNWKLTRAGGCGIVGPLPYTGLPRILTLQADNKYSRSYLGSLTESGRYSLSRRYARSQLDTLVTFANNDTSYQRFLKTSGTELVLWEVPPTCESAMEEMFKKIP